MTDALPARAQHTNGGVDLVAIARQAEAARALGETLIASGLLPDSIKKPEAAVAVMLKGQELQIPPMQALSHIVMVKGKPTMSAELMRALAQRAGHKIRIVESTRESATVEGVRADDPGHPTRITFDEADVKTAGLGGQQGHKTYPAAMKLARATSALCRAVFADALAGISYTPEELGAPVDEEGRVVHGEAGFAMDHRPGREADEEAEGPEEAEVVEDHAPSAATETCSVEQENELRALANALFDEKDATLSGSRWLEETMGQPIADLSPSRAAALIKSYSGKIEAGAGDGE